MCVCEGILVLKYITGSGRVPAGPVSGFFFFKTQTRPYSLSGRVKPDPLGLGQAEYPQVEQKLPSLVNDYGTPQQNPFIIATILLD